MLFFHSVFTSLNIPDALPSSNLGYNAIEEISVVIISVDAVERQLKSLNTTKASLGILSRLLQACAEEIAPSLTKLFNMSLEIGSFPVRWEDTNVVPIHKANSKAMVPNYRGISLRDVLSKLLERLVYDEIFDIICPHLSQWQHGFLPGKSTVSQLSQVIHYFGRALESRQQVDVIYYDFSKAFDKVFPYKLLFKLECLGIKGSLLSWFRFLLHE